MGVGWKIASTRRNGRIDRHGAMCAITDRRCLCVFAAANRKHCLILVDLEPVWAVLSLTVFINHIWLVLFARTVTPRLLPREAASAPRVNLAYLELTFDVVGAIHWYSWSMLR